MYPLKDTTTDRVLRALIIATEFAVVICVVMIAAQVFQ